MATQPLQVACAADHGYLAYCGTMLHSLLGFHPGAVVNFLHDATLPARPLSRLGALVERQGGRWNPLAVDPVRIAGLPRMRRIPPLMWYRILLPELLPDQDRVLYLDVDTLVVDDLAPLWTIPLEDHVVAAVNNVLDESQGDRAQALGIPRSAGYFNSGVLLFNLERMRRQDTTRAIVDYARAHAADLLWPDQDGLNAIMATERLALHPRWNCQNTLFYWDVDRFFPPGEAAAAAAQPAILHFEGPRHAKPWHPDNTHPYRSAWWQHRRAAGLRGPWRGELKRQLQWLRSRLLRTGPRPAAPRRAPGTSTG